MSDVITTNSRILVACGIAGAALPPSINSGSCEILVLPVPVDLPDNRLSAWLAQWDAEVMHVHDYRNVPRDAVRQALLALATQASNRRSAQTIVVRCNKGQLDLVMETCLWSLENRIPAPIRRVASAKIAYFSALLGWYAPPLRNLAKRLFWVLRRMR